VNFFIDAIKNYATFKGRATRQQYWMFYLFYIIFYIILAVLENSLGLTIGDKGDFGEGILTLIYSLGLLIPSLAILARRLHDIGRSGWWILLILIPLIGGLVIFIFTVLDSQRQANEYGESIKY